MKPEKEDEDDDHLASVEWKNTIQLMGMRGVGKKNYTGGYAPEFSSRCEGDRHVSPPHDLPYIGAAFAPHPSESSITTLSNGLIVATRTLTTTNPMASIGIYMRCGFIYEKPETMGVTSLLERMACYNTKDASQNRIGKYVQDIGGNPSPLTSRDHMVFTIDTPKIHVQEVLRLLIGCLTNSLFLKGEVRMEKQELELAIQCRRSNPCERIMEAIHIAAYSGALQNPVMSCIMQQLVMSCIMQQHYSASRMVLVAYGVEHDEFIYHAKSLLMDIPNTPVQDEPMSELCVPQGSCSRLLCINVDWEYVEPVLKVVESIALVLKTLV